MLKVTYTGSDPLDHRSGHWEPGESKMLSRALAKALVRERPDFEFEESKPAEEKRSKKAKVKSAEPIVGEAKEGE